jgi:hypothetical protein
MLAEPGYHCLVPRGSASLRLVDISIGGNTSHSALFNSLGCLARAYLSRVSHAAVMQCAHFTPLREIEVQ